MFATATLYVMCADVQMEESSGLFGNDECVGMSTESESSSDSDLDLDEHREKVCRISVLSWTLNTGYYIIVLLFTGCRTSVR